MNVSILLDMAVEGFGGRAAVGRRADGITAARLRELAAGGAGRIQAENADAVVYLAAPGPAFPVALFAAALAGVPLVPLNYRLGAQQLDQLLANHPRALRIVDAAQAAALNSAGLASRTPVQWLRETADAPAGGEPDGGESPAAIIYTSGTTSRPKGVLLRHENLAAYVLGTVEFASAGEDEASLMSVPPYHIAAVSNVLTNLYAGRRFLTLESFTPERWLATVREEEVTNAMVVPTMLARIMDAEQDRTVPSLRTLAYGGARMPSRVIERALRDWPQVDFVNAYGLTETSSTISVLGPADHRTAADSTDPAVRARLGSAGKPVPGIQMQIRDDDGQVVPPGLTGRIWVRGQQVAGEYAGLGPSTDADGFFDTRDLGHLDGEGYLFIEGRVDDTIIRGGENIAPAEIEDVMLRHPDVDDAVVVGIPDDEWGQRIEAAVVPRPGAVLDPETLRDHVRARLRSSKTPDYIACWTELPRTPTGKIIRGDVVGSLLGERTAS